MAGEEAGCWRWAGWAVVLAAAVVAVVGARPYAGGWNDGSRLSAVESLGGRGTWVVDDSVLVRVPPAEEGVPNPYPPEPPALRTVGTLDKLSINGHFYSDKPPVLSLLLAGGYRAWLAAGGPTAADRPDFFCWWLTVLSSGLAYVIAVECVRRLGMAVGLVGRTHALFTLAFAAAMVAPAYSRHVNGHVVFLATASGLCLTLARCPAPAPGWGRAAVAGFLAGFGYAQDLGIGPPLLLTLVGYAAWVCRCPGPVAVLLAAAAPWVLLHHALNYAVGGTLGPANAVPEYLAWPGSPFTGRAMTGGLKHTPGEFVLYAADLLVGKKGFLLHNLPLLLAPGGALLLWRARPGLRPMVAFAVGWAGLGWLAYAATSTNLSGQCCSVRWFVPLLAPGFWVLGLLLREFPRYRRDFAWLTTCGLVMGVLMWRDGPWAARMVPGYWGLVGVALIGWVVVRSGQGGGEARPWPRAGLRSLTRFYPTIIFRRLM